MHRRELDPWVGRAAAGQQRDQREVDLSHHSAGKAGKLQLGTLPLPETLLTFTPVPEAVMFE